MADDFGKYESMRAGGTTAEAVYRQSIDDGIDPITRVRLIRAVFALTLGQAKDVIVRAEGEAVSSHDQQQKIADALSGSLPSLTKVDLRS